MIVLPFLVTGSTGRIGGALRAVWPETAAATSLQPHWQARTSRPGFSTWDIALDPCPAGLASGVVLGLAGGRRAGTDSGNDETALALATLRAARDQGARHVFLMSSAAVYGASDAPLTEDATPAPPSAYGEQKYAMEAAAQDFAMTEGMRLTLLRLGNVAGFDALLGGARPGVPVTLDPVPGAAGGPLRSYIGPVSLGRVLAGLAQLAAEGAALPDILNIAATPPLRMAALLDAAGIDWRHSPENPAVLPQVVLDCTRLATLLPLPAASAAAMVAEWKDLPA
ncbi:NAD-dependent epimerase/dehydratase family protein [Szabonella alba]|uniref:NAD-dependent epimerase/dehydratase family protein n=1 Tax=Szabonella alba TaxID=2804194 RepID=A0A8K0V7F9_9RHOB|nr:NAD(P)-dependent oxidoreductase [Szabonella alba]MBL4916867.1 NAD-dependent epimerase/dehydratase family protein [Szabonella alba]